MQANRTRCFMPFLLAMLILAAPRPSGAQSGTADATSQARKRLTVHGYLTQAYAATDGHQLLGITEDGTSDYRDFALQFRYAISDPGTFVVQLSHGRKGLSPTQAFHDDVELDWAFYHHQFSSATGVKIGRVPLPIGIFNEFRDAGVLLPFFSPPFSIYQEESFTSETVDGLVLEHKFFADSAWVLETDVYFGGWDITETSASDGIAEAKAQDAVGAQLWLESPRNGLRLGIGFNRNHVIGGVLRLDPPDTWKAFYLSLEAEIARFTFRSEYSHSNIELLATGIPLPDFESDGYYGQLIYDVTDKLSVNLEADFIDVDPNLSFLPSGNLQLWRDYALGLTYDFSPNLVLKIEYHDNESIFIEDASLSLVDPLAAVRYGIVSLAVAF